MIVAGIDLDHDDLAVIDRYDSTYGSTETVQDALGELESLATYQGSDGHHYDPTVVPFVAAKHGRVYVTDGTAK